MTALRCDTLDWDQTAVIPYTIDTTADSAVARTIYTFVTTQSP